VNPRARISEEQRREIESRLSDLVEHPYRIPDEVFEYRPLRDGVILVIEPVARRTRGGIVRTDDTVEAESGGSGYILAAGELSNINMLGSAEVPSGLALATNSQDPSDYCGLKAVFNRWSGVTLRVSDTDADFKGMYRSMRECDLLLLKMEK